MKEYKFKINGNNYAVSVDNVENGIATVAVNGTNYKVEIDDESGAVKSATPLAPQVTPGKYQATPAGSSVSESAAKVNQANTASAGSETPLKSPLPGVILEVRVKVGDMVREGQCLMILEAMKMENNVDANKAGFVKSIMKNAGDSVLEGDVLLTIE